MSQLENKISKNCIPTLLLLLSSSAALAETTAPKTPHIDNIIYITGEKSYAPFNTGDTVNKYSRQVVRVAASMDYGNLFYYFPHSNKPGVLKFNIKKDTEITDPTYEEQKLLPAIEGNKVAEDMIKSVKNQDSLLFIYAGHGSNNSNGTMVCSGKNIQLGDLYQALAKIGKNKKNFNAKFMFDSCFSENQIIALVNFKKGSSHLPKGVCGYAASSVREYNWVKSVEAQPNVFDHIFGNDYLSHFNIIRTELNKTEPGFSFHALRELFLKNKRATPILSSDVYAHQAIEYLGSVMENGPLKQQAIQLSQDYTNFLYENKIGGKNVGYNEEHLGFRKQFKILLMQITKDPQYATMRAQLLDLIECENEPIY